MTRSLAAALLLGVLTVAARAEQMQRIGGYEAHYSVVATTFLRPGIAADYGLVRARDRALVNVAIIDPSSGPVTAQVSGQVKDLLGLVRPLEFREVREGTAVYYLATLRHDDRETLRFSVAVQTPDGARHELTFQQKMYWENR